MNPGLSSLGAPPDAVAWTALGGAISLGLYAVQSESRRERVSTWLAQHSRAALWALAAGAVLLSWVWIVVYLRGGPRIIDATAYFLEGRLLAAGQFTFEPVGPLASHQGRFLIGAPGEQALGVIFPPGYPALLAIGFWLKAPLLMGPVVAGLLVVATYELALRSFGDRSVALLAAALSVCCAALRYHTADTMSHGWSALLFTTALAAAHAGPRGGWLVGLSLGWLLATRPVTGLVLGLVLVALRPPSRKTLPHWWRLLLASIPGLSLWFGHQRALTGQWLGSSQRRYYDLGDAPVDCFRYGFGADVGCRHEHGDFVEHYLQQGYGLFEALGTMGRRLFWHGLDVANAEPLAWLMLAGVLAGARLPAVRLLALGVIAQSVAYAPFYFDGSYPGGGARMLADVLPLEHCLLAWALVRFRVARLGVPVALLGFALRASYGHVALQEREGGRPMFVPEIAEQAGHGLLLVDTDHGYLLGADPSARDPKSQLIVARWRGDAHDEALWRGLGQPTAHLYRHDFTGGPPTVAPFTPASDRPFEAEALWPIWAREEGSAHPAAGAACASGGRVLELSQSKNGKVRVQLLAPPTATPAELIWLARGTGKTRWKVTWDGTQTQGETQVISGTCFRTPAPLPEPLKSPSVLTLELSGAPVALDAIAPAPD